MMKRLFVVALAATALVPPAFSATDEGLGMVHGYKLSTVAQAGIRWVRVDFGWGGMEPEPGIWRFDEQDKFVEECLANGLKLLTILDYGRRQWGDRDFAPRTPERRQEFAEYVRAIVTHFRGRVPAYELWNEPNYDGFWGGPADPKAYAELLKVTYPVVKAIDPQAVLVGCCTGDIDLPYIEEVLKAGGGPYMDAVSVHPYRYNNPPETRFVERVEALRRLLTRYRAPKPIWITEIGWSSPSDQARQADFFIRSRMASYLAGVEKHFWFNYNSRPDEMGISFQTSLGQAFKPAWRACRAMTQITGGGEYLGAMPWRDPLYGVVLRVHGRPVLAFWSRWREIHAALPAGRQPGQVQLFDEYGRPQPITIQRGQVIFTARPSVQYLVGAEAAAHLAAPHFSEPTWTVPAGVRVRWKLPAGKSWYSAATLAGSHLVAACGDASQVIGANLDGTIVWRVPMSQAVVAQPASGPGFVVALLAPDTVGCIDFNGSIRWRHKLPASANEQPPVVVHGMILCSHSGGVTCLDRNGEPRWTNSGPPTHDSSTATATFTRPAWGWLDGQIRLVVGGSDGTVRCLSTSGLELWRTVFAGAMRAPLTVARLSPDEEPRVLARGDDGTLSCLSLTDGRVLWRVAGGTALTFAAPVVAYLPKGSDARGPLEARILWTDYEGMVRCVSAEGKLLWKWMAPGKLKGAPAVVRSGERADIIVADGEGCVTCLSPAGGERWRLIVPGVEEVLETPLVLQQPGTGPRLVISPKHGPLFCLELPGGDKR